MTSAVTKVAAVGVLGIVASALVLTRLIEAVGEAIDAAHATFQSALEDEAASWRMDP